MRVVPTLENGMIFNDDPWLQQLENPRRRYMQQASEERPDGNCPTPGASWGEVSLSGGGHQHPTHSNPFLAKQTTFLMALEITNVNPPQELCHKKGKMAPSWEKTTNHSLIWGPCCCWEAVGWCRKSSWNLLVWWSPLKQNWSFWKWWNVVSRWSGNLSGRVVQFG